MAAMAASLQLHPWWLSNTKSTLLYKPTNPFKHSCSPGPSNSQPNPPETTSSQAVDPVNLASKIEKNPSSDDGNVGSGSGSGSGRSDAIKLAMERAKAYKQKKGTVGSANSASGFQGSLGNERVEKKDKMSSMDFVGLGFADKKEGRGLPAGLVPMTDNFPEGAEVEIIVGNSSNFGAATQKTQGDETDIYKPKVSSWGVFPRPNDISKTFGGGRTIRPGDVLETKEEKAAKEARTRQLIAAYKSKMGINIDPKLQLECEKALNDGDSLMNVGRLKEALPYYEKVMDKLPFKSKLHGLAAIQWSICQDSLLRSNEARTMYERLQSHPTPEVSKKARQFAFSFQAMEMMKVSQSSPWRNTGYQNYFEAFVENKSDYVPEDVGVEVGTINQTLPYIIFLLSPIFMVLIIAIQKRI